jgi:hypothetical protein
MRDERVRDFSALAQRGTDHLDPAMPAGDVEDLLQSAAPVKRFANQYVAHRAADPRMTPDKLPSFDDIDTVTDIIGRIFLKYVEILTDSTYHSLVPLLPPDWDTVFRHPWAGAHAESPRHP